MDLTMTRDDDARISLFLFLGIEILGVLFLFSLWVLARR